MMVKTNDVVENEPLISIIIPVYNLGKRNLELCLNSVVSQTYKNLEILIVDNGSSDDSREICRRFTLTDSRIILLQEEKRGVSNARNLGLDSFHGEYCCFIDGDDIVLPVYIEKLYQALVECRTEIAMCDFKVTDSHNAKASWDYRDLECKKITFDENSTFFLGKYTHKGVPAIMFHKDIVRNVRFDADIHVSEDVLFLANIWHDHSDFAYVPIPMYEYIRYGDSAYNSGFSEKKLTAIDAWRQIREIYKDCDKRLRVNIEAGFLNVYLGLVQDICRSDMSLSYKDYVCTFVREMRRNIHLYIRSAFPVRQKIHYIGNCVSPEIYHKIYKAFKKK